MIVPVRIDYRELEDICYYDDYEKGVVCDDYNAVLEVDVNEVEIDFADLEEIVDQYKDDIIDILLNDRRLVKELLKKLRSRKIDVSAIDEKSQSVKKSQK